MIWKLEEKKRERGKRRVRKQHSVSLPSRTTSTGKSTSPQQREGRRTCPPTNKDPAHALLRLMTQRHYSCICVALPANLRAPPHCCTRGGGRTSPRSIQFNVRPALAPASPHPILPYDHRPSSSAPPPRHSPSTPTSQPKRQHGNATRSPSRRRPLLPRPSPILPDTTSARQAAATLKCYLGSEHLRLLSTSLPAPHYACLLLERYLLARSSASRSAASTSAATVPAARNTLVSSRHHSISGQLHLTLHLR
ncbi:hypothetical protein B0H13DRAFT_2516360 [Mycena leptocephala]|nr:hypothetical protein B0H13DRAFT_2516360 [Mycena leptocephala]